MKTELRPLAEIKPFEGNPRQNDQAVDAVAASIREFGFRQPIVVDNEGEEPNDVDFVYRGTDLSDVFSVSDDGTDATVLLNSQLRVILANVDDLTLAGLDGDDVFNVPVVTVLDNIVLDGGNPGGSDDLNYLADPGTITTVNFDSALVTSSLIGTAPVSFVGVETINVLGTDDAVDDYVVVDYGAPTDVHTLNLDGGDANNENDDGDTIIVNTTSGPDTINYTPMSTSSARITRSQGGPEINISQFNNDDGNLMLVNPGNVDALNVIGSQSSDTIDVIQVAADTTRVTVNAVDGTIKWVPIQYQNLNSLTVSGNLGDDTLISGLPVWPDGDGEAGSG